MEYQETWERRIRLGYQNTKDRKILDEIKRSPLPPCISVDGSNQEVEGSTLNSAGATIFVTNELPDNMQWDGSKWRPLMARVRALPLKMGFEDTDNNTGEVTAASLAEEMLPPGLGAVIFADSTTSIALYRTIRDGTIISSRAMVRKILSGCGKATVGKLMRNLALWSVTTKNMMATSAALHYTLPLPSEPFYFLEMGLRQ